MDPIQAKIISADQQNHQKTPVDTAAASCRVINANAPVVSRNDDAHSDREDNHIASRNADKAAGIFVRDIWTDAQFKEKNPLDKHYALNST